MYDINLIESYFLTVPVSERDTKPAVTEKTNQFVSLKIGKFQILYILKLLPNLIQSRKLTRHQGQKNFSHTIDSTAQINWTTKNIFRTKSLTTNYKIATFLKTKI